MLFRSHTATTENVSLAVDYLFVHCKQCQWILNPYIQDPVQSTDILSPTLPANVCKWWRSDWQSVNLYLFIYFSCVSLPIHCRCRALLLPTITLNDTYAISRPSLDEWSARRRNLYVSTHDNHNKHPWTRLDSNPQSQHSTGHRMTS
jgi:hypothetical protein